MEEFPKQEKPSVLSQETDKVIPPNRVRWEGGKLVEITPEERQEAVERARAEQELAAQPTVPPAEAGQEITFPEPESPAGVFEAVRPEAEPGDETVRITPEQRAVSFREYVKSRVQSSKNFEELFQAFADAERVGGSFETSGVPFSAQEWQKNAQTLLERIRSGGEVSDADLQTITREGGLRRRVEDLLRIEKVKLLLESAA